MPAVRMLGPRCSGQMVFKRSVVRDCGDNFSFLPVVSGPGSISFGLDWYYNSNTEHNYVCFGQGRGRGKVYQKIMTTSKVSTLRRVGGRLMFQ